MKKYHTMGQLISFNYRIKIFSFSFPYEKGLFPFFRGKYRGIIKLVIQIHVLDTWGTSKILRYRRRKIIIVIIEIEILESRIVVYIYTVIIKMRSLDRDYIDHRNVVERFSLHYTMYCRTVVNRIDSLFI